MKISCGALFYSYNDQNQLGIILGLERGGWLPFKGCNEANETYEQTAIREVAEETCFLVSLPNISLDHTFSSHIKIYKIGLCYVPFEFIDEFARVRKHEQREKSKEKYEVKFFPIKTIKQNFTIHPLAVKSIEYYWSILHNKKKLQSYSTKAIFNIPRPKLSRSASEIVMKYLRLNKPIKARSQSVTLGKKYNGTTKFTDIVKSTKVISPPGVTLYDLKKPTVTKNIIDETLINIANNINETTVHNTNNIDETSFNIANDIDESTATNTNNIDETITNNINNPNIVKFNVEENADDIILDQKLGELVMSFDEWMNIMENQFNEKFDKILKNKCATTPPVNMIKSNLLLAHDNFVEMFDVHNNLPTQQLIYNNKQYKQNDLIEQQMLQRLVSCLSN